MQMTVTVPDELASRLAAFEPEIPQILALGMREYDARQNGFAGVSEVLEKLATLPAPEEIVALKPSAQLQARISELLEKNREGGLSAEEESEWQRYEYVEHVVRIAKGRAMLRLQGKL